MLTFDFLKNKYGTELLVDLGRIETLDNYVLEPVEHRITFYEILFVTEGNGSFDLDEWSIPIQPGTVIVICPHQVRRWHVETPVAGFSFFFEEDFLNTYFSDPVFVNRFIVFDYARPAPSLRVTEPALYDKCLYVLREVEAEIGGLSGDSSHILRALLYYIIGLVDRLYRAQHDLSEKELHPTVYAFRKLLNRHIREWHTVEAYARALRVSTNHLNTLTKKHLLKTPSEVIAQRLMLEAKRDVRFSGKTVSEVAYDLGFSDPSNFSRFFKRHTGQSPRAYQLAK